MTTLVICLLIFGCCPPQDVKTVTQLQQISCPAPAPLEPPTFLPVQVAPVDTKDGRLYCMTEQGAKDFGVNIVTIQNAFLQCNQSLIDLNAALKK